MYMPRLPSADNKNASGDPLDVEGELPHNFHAPARFILHSLNTCIITTRPQFNTGARAAILLPYPTLP